MKERILEDATDLIKNSELAKEYNEAIAKFRDHANLESEPSGTSHRCQGRG